MKTDQPLSHKNEGPQQKVVQLTPKDWMSSADEKTPRWNKFIHILILILPFCAFRLLVIALNLSARQKAEFMFQCLVCFQISGLLL